MKSNFSRPFRFNSWISTNQYQKKVTETKVEKILNGIPKNGTFDPMISWVYNNHSCEWLIFHLRIFMSEYGKEKTCWNVPGWLQDQSKWSILMASFWQQFLHSKSDFWLKPTIPRGILHLLGMRWAKKITITLWWSSYTRETLSPGQRIFSRSTLFNKSFS